MTSANDENLYPSKKNWREISKGKGAIITIVIVSLYTFLHFWFTKNGQFPTLTYISTIGFFIGFTFGFLEIIKPGETDTLIFGGKKTKREWDDGYCLTPSVLPFLHRIDFRPLWSLMNKHWNQETRIDNVSVFNHDLRIDSANQQKINIDSSLLEATLFQTVKKFFEWFFSMNRNCDFAFQEFGLKMIIIAAILDIFNLSATGTVNAYNYIFSPKEKIVSEQVIKESNSSVQETKKQDSDEKVYLMPNGDLIIRDKDQQITIPSAFPRKEKGSNQSDSVCKWDDTNWEEDLVEKSLDFRNRDGCLEFYPPIGKPVGMIFSSKPTKAMGDFTVTSQYSEKSCTIKQNEDCLNFIGSHLNEVLVFEGLHIYVDLGK